ncbi:MAG: nucleotide exchange factor GrpE [Pirellulaceae bacterium]|nr:nucleotide exchange factor GrpE [Pirellulaceae bacterium]
MSKTTHTDANAAAAVEPETCAEESETAARSGGTANQDQVNAIDQALADAVSAEPGEIGLPAQIQSLQADLAAAEARVLRAHAELENYRKRANRHLEEEKKYAALPLMRDLLPVVDNLERAIQSADQEGGSARLVEGVKMVSQLLAMVLERHHCRRIEAQGAVFDPHVHEAIAQLPSEQVPPGNVLEVAQNGYQLHDRVVRPAQVMVSGRPAATPQPGPGGVEQ